MDITLLSCFFDKNCIALLARFNPDSMSDASNNSPLGSSFHSRLVGMKTSGRFPAPF
jgi:hypothetical protein